MRGKMQQIAFERLARIDAAGDLHADGPAHLDEFGIGNAVVNGAPLSASTYDPAWCNSARCRETLVCVTPVAATMADTERSS